MIKYQIPLKRHFLEKFQHAVTPMSLHSALRFYERFKEKIDRHDSQFDLPQPSEFKEKFKQEVKNMEACKIFYNYDVEKLHGYGIATKDLLNAKKTYVEFINEYKLRREITEDSCTKKLKNALAEFQTVLNRASGKYSSHEGWIRQLKRETEHLEKSHPDRWFSSNLAIMKQPDIDPDQKVEESLSNLFEAHKTFLKNVEDAEMSKATNLSLLENAFKKEREKINTSFKD
ncbi:MAG: hypothetical protein K940chlam6_01208, partial [Chlamydiae bacterium]|nr:hypothetical protein [Chlamydiota bacterium]